MHILLSWLSNGVKQNAHAASFNSMHANVSVLYRSQSCNMVALVELLEW